MKKNLWRGDVPGACWFATVPVSEAGSLSMRILLASSQFEHLHLVRRDATYTDSKDFLNPYEQIVETSACSAEGWYDVNGNLVDCTWYSDDPARCSAVNVTYLNFLPCFCLARILASPLQCLYRLQTENWDGNCLLQWTIQTISNTSCYVLPLCSVLFYAVCTSHIRSKASSANSSACCACGGGQKQRELAFCAKDAIVELCRDRWSRQSFHDIDTDVRGLPLSSGGRNLRIECFHSSICRNQGELTWDSHCLISRFEYNFSNVVICCNVFLKRLCHPPLFLSGLCHRSHIVDFPRLTTPMA